MPLLEVQLCFGERGSGMAPMCRLFHDQVWAQRGLGLKIPLEKVDTRTK